MKTAAFFLKLLFTALLLTTLGLLASEVTQYHRTVTTPAFTYASKSAPSVYYYVKLSSRQPAATGMQ